MTASSLRNRNAYEATLNRALHIRQAESAANKVKAGNPPSGKPDGGIFAAASDKEIYVWDVALLRQHLRSIDLDWEPNAAGYQPAVHGPTIPLIVEVIGQ